MGLVGAAKQTCSLLAGGRKPSVAGNVELQVWVRLTTIWSGSSRTRLSSSHRPTNCSSRPPRHSRLRKGLSCNPFGRRKGSGIRSALEKVLDRKVTAKLDGERRKVPLTEPVVLQLAQKALSGDVRSIREVLKIAD